jgi:ribosome biogenesis protein SSF1/2
MMPFTAVNFKEDAKNRKHTLSAYSKELAMPMGVSHILALSQNAEHLNLRLARVPEGPTMTFRVTQFSLIKHVRAIQRRPYTSPGINQHSPIVVTNNFGDATAPPHVKLMRITFQNMFPAINVATVKLSECRRVVLFNLMEEEGIVELRHYAIKATPVGVDRKVRRIVQTKIPNLNKLNDIADYITGTTASGDSAPAASGGNVSDSEPEDETSHVVLAQKYTGRGNAKQQKSALKLVELGPRLSIKILKVERGLGGGDVMYHALIKKTPEEVRELKQRKEKEVMLKKQRRDQQDRNVEKKRKIKDEKLDRKKQKKDEREREAMDALRRGAEYDDDDDDSEDDAEDDGSEDQPDLEEVGDEADGESEGDEDDDEMDEE